MAGDLRGLLNPLKALTQARARYREIPEQVLTPTPTPEVPDPDPIVVPARTEVYVDPADMPPQIVTDGFVDLGAQLALVQAAVGQIDDQRLVHTSAAVKPPALTAPNTDVDVTVAWDEGTAQTVPAVVSLVPVGPGPLQQRAISARVVEATTAGVTVRFRTKRALTGPSVLDPDDRYVINALYLYTPPFQEAP